MAQTHVTGLTTRMANLVVVVVLFVLADAGIVAVRLASDHPTSSSSPVAQTRPGQSTHPCNHGFYVSQAAHSKKGGSYVSGIARSNLGMQGSCTAPLPAHAPSNTSSGD